MKQNKRAYLAISVICYFLFVSGTFVSALDGGFVGLGGEANGNSKEKPAAGGILTMGLDINSFFAVGLKNAVSFSFEDLIVLENAAFFRYYPIKNMGLFLQADLGATVLFENEKAKPVFLGGLLVGWRFNFGKFFYLEPSARGGYPFIWGAGLTAGVKIKS